MIIGSVVLPGCHLFVVWAVLSLKLPHLAHMCRSHCVLGGEVPTPGLGSDMFLCGVPLKECPLSSGSRGEAETALSCLLVSLLQLGQKFSFDLGVKEAGWRILEKIEFWSLDTGRKVGRTGMSRAIWPQTNDRSHVPPPNLLWSLNHLLSLVFPKWGKAVDTQNFSVRSHSSSLLPSLPS